MRRTRQHWRWLVLMLVIGLALGTGSTTTQAQDNIAAACNGGTGMSGANGGAAAIGDVSSGENAGNAILLGDTGGGAISGGAVANSTDGAVDVNGGTGITDGSGGDECIGFKYTPPPAPDEPEEEDVDFQVCVVIPGSDVFCGPGNCTGPSGNAVCDRDSCDDLPVGIDPCTFDECEVNANATKARCVYELG